MRAIGARHSASPSRMQVQPAYDEFQRRYALGTPVLAWTTLVADLETPVSAMLKLADGRPMSFLLESVEGGEKIGRYSDHRHQARPGVALLRRPRRDQPARAHRSRRVRAGGHGRARLAAHAHRPIPRRDAGAAAADGVGPVRLHGLRHGRADGAHPRHQPRHARHSRRPLPAPDGGRDLRQHRRHHHHRDAGLARRRDTAACRLRPRAGAARRRGRRPRAQPAAPARNARGDAGTAGAIIQHDARAMPAHGRDGEGLCPRRRDLSGRAVDALCRAVSPPAVRALPRAAPAQSVAVPVLPRFRRLRGGGLEPRDPGAPARRHGQHPPARRHAPPRRQFRGGSAPRRGAARRSQGARRAPDAAWTSRATTSAAWQPSAACASPSRW